MARPPATATATFQNETWTFRLGPPHTSRGDDPTTRVAFHVFDGQDDTSARWAAACLTVGANTSRDVFRRLLSRAEQHAGKVNPERSGLTPGAAAVIAIAHHDPMTRDWAARSAKRFSLTVALHGPDNSAAVAARTITNADDLAALWDACPEHKPATRIAIARNRNTPARVRSEAIQSGNPKLTEAALAHAPISDNDIKFLTGQAIASLPAAAVRHIPPEHRYRLDLTNGDVAAAAATDPATPRALLDELGRTHPDHNVRSKVVMNTSTPDSTIIHIYSNDEDLAVANKAMRVITGKITRTRRHALYPIDVP